MTDARAATQHEMRTQARPDLQKTAASTGRISGHVYRADTAEPISKAIVTLRAERIRMTQTGADGSFSFANLDSGSYLVEVTRTGFVSADYVDEKLDARYSYILLKAGESRDKVDVRLKTAGGISGKVTDLEGDPVEGLDVFAIRPSYSEGGQLDEHEMGRAKTDDRGEFRLAGLRPGAYFVRAGASGKNTGAIVRPGTWTYRTSYYPGVSQMDEAQTIQVKGGADVSAINLQVASVSRNVYEITGTVSGESIASEIIAFAGDQEIETVRVGGGENALQTFNISGLSPGQYTIVAQSRGGLRSLTSSDGSSS